MYKNEKGISMIMLVIMVIVMLILAGIIIYGGTSAISSAKKQSIYTNMLLIQAKARTINDKVSFGEAQYIGTQLTNSEEIKKLGIDEQATVYKLTQEDLYAMELEVTGDNDYVVDYKNDEVYYIKGIKDKDGNLNYRLTDIANLEIITEE